jgi:hypothetical protein
MELYLHSFSRLHAIIHNEACEQIYDLVVKCVIFWDMTPCSLIIFTLKMEASCSSEAFVTIYQTTRGHIPEDIYLQGFYLATDELSTSRGRHSRKRMKLS